MVTSRIARHSSEGTSSHEGSSEDGFGERFGADGTGGAHEQTRVSDAPESANKRFRHLLDHLGHAEHAHNAAAKTTEPANLTGQTEALPVHPDPGLKLGDRHLVEVASPKQVSTDNKTER
jgi:hypothetical protein